MTHRRTFLADMGLGFTGLALSAMLQRDGVVPAASPLPAAGEGPGVRGNSLHHPAKAKSVIWIFLSGGYSHLETFDPKPALNRYAGLTFDRTPFANPLRSPLHDQRSRSVVAAEINQRDTYPIIYPMQVGWRRHGQSGIEVCDWLPHIASCVDDLTFVRSIYTTDNDHAAENQIHTGRHRLDEVQPSIGSWVHYGLRSLNDNLPSFLVLGGPTRSDTRASIDANYLGPRHAGIPLNLDTNNPLPNGRRSPDVLADEQRNEFDLINRLNGLAAVEYPDDPNLRARIRSYELAFRMQTAVPEAIGLMRESEATRRLYGLDQANTRLAGERLLAARRLVERGVRFVQVYPSPYGVWDSHRALRSNHERLCATIDKPVAGLLKDLKQRGLMDDVLVVFCTEFGRTPGLEQRGGGRDGRDHHPHGFTVFFAGAGVKKGHVHGATDELGFHALEPGHYVTDMHATVLHLLGLDGRRLEVPGRRRLNVDFGEPILEILA
ncbi:MAG: DUF1501 domain-containing protein [Planctomycetes bacterium]|nr:DUF1501 domain-containing protein [Planctomycetota bacterium]